MAPWLVLMCIMAVCIGLWVNNLKSPSAETTSSAPDTYTRENVRRGETYHVEEDGDLQLFEVISIHWSGHLLIEVTPPDGQELDRDHPPLGGWTRELPANRLIRPQHLLRELPIEVRFSAN